VTTTAKESPTPYIEALQASYNRLCDLVVGADQETLEGPSGCATWSLAQLLSHLGSGAEIFAATLDMFAASGTTPDISVNEEIWARWNALNSVTQARRWHEVDGALIERLRGGRQELDRFTTTLFGFYPADGAGFVRLRLGEHALHLFDVEVITNPDAIILDSAASLLVAHFANFASFLGHPESIAPTTPLSLVIELATMQRSYHLHVSDTVTVAPSPASKGDLTMSAEGFIRLITGRTHHGRRVGNTANFLTLTKLFPGF